MRRSPSGAIRSLTVLLKSAPSSSPWGFNLARTGRASSCSPPARDRGAVDHRTRGRDRVHPASCRPQTPPGYSSHALSQNLHNFIRTLAIPKAVEPWSLDRPLRKLIKIDAESRARAATSRSTWPRSRYRVDVQSRADADRAAAAPASVKRLTDTAEVCFAQNKLKISKEFGHCGTSQSSASAAFSTLYGWSLLP
jgi:hypothetical protein